MSSHVPALPEQWRTVDAVPLPDVARAANLTRRDLLNAVDRGYLHTVPGRVGWRGALYLPRAEIEAVFTGLAIAAASGLSFSYALRAALALPTLSGARIAA